MNKLRADILFVNISEFLDVQGASNFRRTHTQARDAIDSSEFWDNFIESSKNDSPYTLKHTSYGLGGIISRQSLKENMCVTCGEYSCSFPIPCGCVTMHPFFGVMVCQNCTNHDPMLSIINEKDACKKYLIDPDDMENIAHIKKRSIKVLDYAARYCGELKHGKEKIQSILDKRDKRRMTIKRNRILARNKRVIELEAYMEMKVDGSIRADSYFRLMSNWRKVISEHTLSSYLLHDIFEYRVSVDSTVKIIGDDIFDFCCLLTYCKNNGVLMEDYKTPCLHHHDFIPRTVFNNSKNGGIHYYEFMCRYTDSIKQLTDRSKSVEIYTKRDGTSLNEDDRRSIVDILCLEDYIVFDYEKFQEYIEDGIGDPVLIAREIRKMDIIISMGYYEWNEYLLYIGMCQGMASKEARRATLLESNGLPIMNRYLLDDRIPTL